MFFSTILKFNMLELYFLLFLDFILCSFLVLSSKNPIYSILYLILCFFHGSFISLLLDVEFLGLVLIIIYIGAIAILFLFVIMMLNIKENEKSLDINIYEIIISVFMFLFFYYINSNTFVNFNEDYISSLFCFTSIFFF